MQDSFESGKVRFLLENVRAGCHDSMRDTTHPLHPLGVIWASRNYSNLLTNAESKRPGPIVFGTIFAH